MLWRFLILASFSYCIQLSAMSHISDYDVELRNNIKRAWVNLKLINYASTIDTRQAMIFFAKVCPGEDTLRVRMYYASLDPIVAAYLCGLPLQEHEKLKAEVENTYSYSIILARFFEMFNKTQKLSKDIL